MSLQFDLLLEHSSTFRPASVAAAVRTLAAQGDVASRGAVFTRLEVVDFILDLAGYTSDRLVYQRRILEPSFGGGDFLFPATRRLLKSWRAHGSSLKAVDQLADSVRAVELHQASFEATRSQLITLLTQEDVSRSSAVTLADQWLVQGDFLLEPLKGEFDFVVGNPPYVRQELIPEALLAEYRSRYRTLYDRADLYIPFIERSLSLLGRGGQLAFICADRWMKNRYGGPLRSLVAQDFHLKAYVVDTAAFHSDVIAYPAVVLIERADAGTTRIALRPPIEATVLAELAISLRDSKPAPASVDVRAVTCVMSGSEPWLLEMPGQMCVLRRLEQTLPTLEETGCKVGIGVATGADSAFIGDFDSLDVEDDRKLPLVMTRDIDSGEVKWRGQGVINPFADDGGLVKLGEYPRLARYLEARKGPIAGRHCAQKSPLNWYRTIDRIWPSLTHKPKLLIPDIKGDAHIVFEQGKLYPHHNLYFVTSDQWELRALQAVLLSSVARLFVASYSTKMRGGYLRFQAQYLRRIRLPHWQDVPKELRHKLRDAAIHRDFAACNQATYQLYGIDDHEAATLASGT